ncbi:hypothetical protein HDU97_007545, partial [Phlyctochytrium planicorne]
YFDIVLSKEALDSILRDRLLEVASCCVGEMMGNHVCNFTVSIVCVIFIARNALFPSLPLECMGFRRAI